MPGRTVKFNGKVVAWVEVPSTEWNQACSILGAPQADADYRECVAVAKLLQAGITCLAPQHAAYDVILVIQGQRQADIKTLYYSYGIENGTVQEKKADILDLIDREVDKEDRQGTQCLFDLSYIDNWLREQVVGAIHNCYPHAMTLEYDLADNQIHFIYPRVVEYHRGDWYH